jgi:hypothetical protein
MNEALKTHQKKLVGHGILQIASTLLFGVGYWMKLVGGFEVVPGKIWHFNVPGSDEGWRRAHTGPALNGMMVIAAAAALPMVNLPEKEAKRLTNIVMLDGWSNVLFYFFGNFAPSRGLSFGPNKHGKTNIFGIIALGPAYLFGALGLWALFKLGVAAFAVPAEQEEPDISGNGQVSAPAAGLGPAEAAAGDPVSGNGTVTPRAARS